MREWANGGAPGLERDPDPDQRESADPSAQCSRCGAGAAAEAGEVLAVIQREHAGPGCVVEAGHLPGAVHHCSLPKAATSTAAALIPGP